MAVDRRADTAPDPAIEQYRALGHAVVAFQHLESAVTQALLWITDPDWESRKTLFLPKILNELSFSARLRLLSNFVHTTSLSDFVRQGSKFAETRASEYPELVNKLKEGIALAQKSEERRNQLVHSQWFTGGRVVTPTPGGILRFKKRLKADRDVSQYEHVTSESINAVVRSMEEAAVLISSASWRLGGDAVFNALSEDDPLPSSSGAV